jgi:hypothetical protein
MDLIGVRLSRNTTRSINSGHRFIGNFTLIIAVLTRLEIALPNLSIGNFTLIIVVLTRLEIALPNLSIGLF